MYIIELHLYVWLSTSRREIKSYVMEDTHKKSIFLVFGPLRFYPPYTKGLVVHVNFFFLKPETDFDNFFLFLPNFLAKTAGF